LTPLEAELALHSGGRYDLAAMALRRRLPRPAPGVAPDARLECRGRVSVVTPTMGSRQRYHEALWECFEAQTWEDKELVVLETYDTEPSAFLRRKAAEDERLVHVCIPTPPGDDFSVGLKRNMTLHLASGEFVVNFDDDDLYAADYVEAMVGEMQARGLHAVTLSSWFNYYVGTGVCTYSDPESWDEWASDDEDLDEILYGYGFSYAHRRQVALDQPYPDAAFAEDAPFLLGLRAAHGKAKVGLKQDTEGLCMHIMHRANSAQVLGSREVAKAAVQGLAVARLRAFRAYDRRAAELHAQCRWWSTWPAWADPFSTVLADVVGSLKALHWDCQAAEKAFHFKCTPPAACEGRTCSL